MDTSACERKDCPDGAIPRIALSAVETILRHEHMRAHPQAMPA